NVTTEILILNSVREHSGYVSRVNALVLRIEIGAFKADLFQKLFHDRLQSTRADIFGLLIDLSGEVRDRVDGVLCKLDRDALSLHHRLILFDQRVPRLSKNSFEVFNCERLQFDANRKTSLKLRYQVRRL